MNSSLLQDLQAFKKALDFKLDDIESQVLDQPQQYKNLNPQALYTSLENFHEIFQSKRVTGTWVDLGCGLAHSCLLYSWLFPQRFSLGLEISKPRVEAAKVMATQLGIQNIELHHADLLSCEIPDADTYFLYFPTGPVLDRILCELRKKTSFKTLVAIESHGDLFPRLALEKSLKLVETLKSLQPRLHDEIRIFENAFDKSTHLPFDLSFQNHILYVEDDRLWLAESFGLEWIGENQFQLLHPPRTISWEQVKRIGPIEELEIWAQRLMKLRRLGELEIRTENKTIPGFIRKIAIAPRFELEISSGEWVKWSEIKSIHFKGILCYDSHSQFYSYPLAAQ